MFTIWIMVATSISVVVRPSDTARIMATMSTGWRGLANHLGILAGVRRMASASADSTRP